MSCKSPCSLQRPKSGQYLIHIMSVKLVNDCYILPFDIAVGPYVGYAHAVYLQAGTWPLVWRINRNTGVAVVQHALQALNSDSSIPIGTLTEAIGMNLTVDIGLYQKKHFEVRRSYPASAYKIMPDDIRIGTTSWKTGMPDVIRAIYLANLSGLPVLCADAMERKSPMVDWCAEHNIILLPSSFPAGDYTLPNSNTIIDRKADLFELNRNFASSAEHASYENAAFYAAALNKRLLYLVATSPEDNVHEIKDLKHWNPSHPKKAGQTVDGTHLSRQLTRHMKIHSNVDFQFVPKNNLCERIYHTLFMDV